MCEFMTASGSRANDAAAGLWYQARQSRETRATGMTDWTMLALLALAAFGSGIVNALAGGGAFLDRKSVV